MAPKNMLKQVASWAGKKLLGGMLFVAGGALLLAGVYAFQTLSNNPATDSASTFSSNSAPMLTRSGGLFDRETMSMEALSDYVTAVTLISPVNGSQLAYNGGSNASGTTLSWGTVPKATGYIVYIGTSQGTMVAQPSTTGTTYSVGGLTKNTSYYWQVVANMPGGRTKPSSIWVFTTNCPSTETLDGGTSCISQKTIGDCATPSAANYVFFNNTITYAPVVTWNGSSWNTTPTTLSTPKSGNLLQNTCEWKCAAGYGWHGSSCISSPSTTPSTACGAPNSSAYGASVGGDYQFYNGSTSYTPRVTWNTGTYVWDQVTATNVTTSVTTPAIDTCQWKVVCTGGYSWNSSISRCERTVFTNTIRLGTDDAWGNSQGTVYSRCPTGTYLSEFKLTGNWSMAGSNAWNAYYSQCLVAYQGTTSQGVVWQSTNTHYSHWSSNFASYGTTTYTNSNANIDGIALSGGGSLHAHTCNTWGYEVTRAIYSYSIGNASAGGQFSLYYSNGWGLYGAGANDQGASGPHYYGSTQYAMKCALK